MEPQAARLVDGLRDALGADLVGVYLHGSAVLGGLRPRSDIDVVAVTRRRMTRAQRQGLVDLVLELSGHPRPIELDVVVQSEIKPWRYPPRTDSTTSSSAGRTSSPATSSHGRTRRTRTSRR